MTGGLPVLLAFLQDLLQLAATPVTLAYLFYLKLYKLQLHYTVKTWQLMRGSRFGFCVTLCSLHHVFGELDTNTQGICVPDC